MAARRRSIPVVIGILLLASAGPARAQDGGPTYPISRFNLEYVRENPDHPPLEDVAESRVQLGVSADGAYVAPGTGGEDVAFRISKAPLQGRRVYHFSGLQAVLERVRDYLLDEGLIGVYVAPDPYEIDEQGRDLRAEGQTELTLIIHTGAVTEMRTLGSGQRVKPEERVNNPKHAPILEGSPVRPWEPGDEERTDLLRRDTLDRYVFFKSRHPGRRVDVAVAAAQEPGGVALDYLITENRPLSIYGQVSNTGTESTGKWVVRAGFYHTQLTGNDDVLSVDYSTAEFNSHAVLAGYERPFPNNDRLRWRAYGLGATYNADQVGVLFQEFEGDSWRLGGEVIGNVWQEREAFLDVIGGARFQYESTENSTFLISGQETFFLPYAGVRYEKITEWMATTGIVTLEGQLADTDQVELNSLGRLNTDGNWAVLNWHLSHSVFLERLLNPEGWADPSTPKSSTLAHEVAVDFKGQWAFDYRLIPQAQYVMGGLYTVRGYPQSIAAGDTGVVLNAEYRYHLPRALGLEPEPTRLFNKPFRRAPQYVYGRPDWDLILRGFFDLGFTVQNDPFFFEENETLMGAGFGVEFQYRRNVTARLDVGFALRDVPRAGVDTGDVEVHLAVTLVY